MAQVPPQQIDEFTAAIQSHDFLHRVMREIERLQKVVFHSEKRADWARARRCAEQILIAELISRHKGNIDGIYNSLRQMEIGGKPWAMAIKDLAAYIQAYYTTPLGIVMRRDLFGDRAIFLSPDAVAWGEGGQRAAAEPPKEPT